MGDPNDAWNLDFSGRFGCCRDYIRLNVVLYVEVTIFVLEQVQVNAPPRSRAHRLNYRQNIKVWPIVTGRPCWNSKPHANTSVLTHVVGNNTGLPDSGTVYSYICRMGAKVFPSPGPTVASLAPWMGNMYHRAADVVGGGFSPSLDLGRRVPT